MNYRFENTYTYADFVSWGLEVRNILNSAGSGPQLIWAAYVVQFCLWAPISYFLLTLDIPFALQTILLFGALVLAGRFYETFIFSKLSAHLDRKSGNELPQKFSSIIEVDDTGIKVSDRAREISYSWDAFYAVRDTEKNVIFISDTIHCVIPAGCFPGFLEKDAFVRACSMKVEATTPQGQAFT
ncbi:hypothetical protein [Litorimonas sp. WD9-15]|uniref:hypothetical protein n=1 Tax=Litorimonas sp. WD9-15 TaxID=3418716 RepID=UPI003D057FAF